MIVGLATILSILCLDQALKWWIVQHLALGEAIPLLPGLLSLTHIRNQGASWGILAGQQLLFILITLLVVAYFAYKIYHQQASSWMVNLAYACLVGGALGNLVDRLFNGYVVDMLQLDFMSFPIFNIADTALTVGVVLMLCFGQETDFSFRKESK